MVKAARAKNCQLPEGVSLPVRVLVEHRQAGDPELGPSPGSRGPAEPGRGVRLPGMQCRLGDADPVGHLANADARVAADLAGSLDQVPGPVGVEVAWDLYHRARC